VTCAGCTWGVDAERAAIVEVEAATVERRQITRAPESVQPAHTCGEREVTIVYLSPERFGADPQVGVPIAQGWPSFVRWLTTPTYAAAKQAGGAWTPCELPAGKVLGGKGPVSLLVLDVDHAGPEGLARSADVCGAYEGVIVPSFSATPENQKHRLVLTLSRPLTADEFPVAWRKCAADLELAGIVVDPACKNINRLWFAPVARSRETWLGARILTGAPVDVDRMREAAHADEEAARVAREQARAHRPPSSSPASDSADRGAWVRTQVDRRISDVYRATEGERHGALLRAAYSLGCLPELSADTIADALIGPFVSVAGESRRTEGEKTIKGAVEAGKAAS